MTAVTEEPQSGDDNDGGVSKLPWNARMLDATVFTPARRGKKAYDAAEVDDFKERVVDRVAWLEDELAAAITEKDGAREALALRADGDAAQRNAALNAPTTMAVSAVAAAQRQAEQDADVIRTEAYSDAERIRANAEEDARRILAGATIAARTASEDQEQPEVAGSPTSMFLAHVQRLSARRPALVSEIEALRAELADVDAQIAEVANVLPMAQKALPAPVLEVAEVEKAS